MSQPAAASTPLGRPRTPEERGLGSLIHPAPSDPTSSMAATAPPTAPTPTAPLAGFPTQALEFTTVDVPPTRPHPARVAASAPATAPPAMWADRREPAVGYLAPPLFAHPTFAGPGATFHTAPSVAAAVVGLGRSTCTDTSVVTPIGTLPAADIRWQADLIMGHGSRVPAWAIVLAVCGFVLFGVIGVAAPLCWLVSLGSLLLLGVREPRLQSVVRLQLHSPNGPFYVEDVPVRSQAEINDLYRRLNYANYLAHRARRAS